MKSVFCKHYARPAGTESSIVPVSPRLLFPYAGVGGILLLIIVLSLMISGCSRPESQLVGSKAADFTLERLDGSPVSLSDLNGKPVLLEFWAPWCPGCLDNIAPLKELYSSFGDRVHILAPSLEGGRKALDFFINKHNITYPIALATRTFLDDYKVGAIPATVIIDANGIIRYHHLGRITVKSMSKKLESLL